MKSVDQLADEIVAREGGFVNDPDDPGGATKFGVTIGTLRRLGLDLTGDGRVTEADVRALTRTEAARIFKDQYYAAPRIHMLPAALQPPIFDMQVNAGSNAVRILQRLLAEEHGRDLAVDGVIGPQTARAAHEVAAEIGGDALAVEYGIARRGYYYALAAARPASRKFAVRRDGGKGGWIARAEEFLPPGARLSEAEHRAIVEGWA